MSLHSNNYPLIVSSVMIAAFVMAISFEATFPKDDPSILCNCGLIEQTALVLVLGALTVFVALIRQ